MGVRLTIVKQLANGWFILFVCLYFLHQWAAVNGYSVPLLRSYFGDLLAIPILLHLITISIRFILKKPSFRADWMMLISLWLIVSIVFEGILPYYYDRYTQDFIDVFVYALGLVIALFTVYKEKSTL